MGVVPARIQVCRTWRPPDVCGVSGYSGTRPGRARHPSGRGVTTSPDHEKKLLRGRMRAARLAHCAGIDSAAIAVPGSFARLVEGRRVAGYVAMPGEADPVLLLQAAADAGATLLLPHIAQRGALMRFVALGEVATGPYGVAQPLVADDAEPPDVVLAPLVAFDDRLMRLGQGGGHYDRALAALPRTIVIGIAFAMQRVASLPIDPWDVPLSGVITEQGLSWRSGATA